MPMKRICMVPTDAEKYDRTWNITVDLFLDDAGVSTDRMTAFGARGGMAPFSGGIEPFLLFKDGTLDFGTDHDDEYRNCHLNLRGSRRVVQQNELFTFKGHDEELTYRVQQAIELQ
ncbi:hypothetical protein [Pararhodobacter oceanensis]|uniref:hypothetical protein n=1 Tax=Pararhodobacter oceanensis TaxID=2172121 RepID=UPI003A921281